MSDKLATKLMHYMGKAIADYKMIKTGDRVLVCLSGGKDSYTMLTLLHRMQVRSNKRFQLQAYTLDQSHPGWDDQKMRDWLTERKIPFKIETRDTYSVVKEKIPEGKTYCSLCSRLRRGNIYRYAEENGFNKVALGHHRDDLIQTLLMSILYSGQIRSMPPKLKTDSGRQIVIRPMVYCQEKDIKAYAESVKFPIIPCNLCGTQENLARQRVARLIDQLASENSKVPSNMLHALQSVSLSQLMDKKCFDFNSLDDSSDINLDANSSASSNKNSNTSSNTNLNTSSNTNEISNANTRLNMSLDKNSDELHLLNNSDINNDNNKEKAL